VILISTPLLLLILLVYKPVRQIVGWLLFLTLVFAVYACSEMPPAHAQGGPPEFHALNGSCDTKSSSDYGPSEADISVPPYATPLRCNEAVFVLLRDFPDHVMIDFVQKGAGGLVDGVAFSGLVSEDRRKMTVDQVYFRPGVPTPVKESLCTFGQSNGNFTSIECDAAIEGRGARQAAVVNFIAASGQ
jgi:hypothetical protein